MEINVCVPVLKRYDLLRLMMQSLKLSTTKPSMLHIIDNGLNTQSILAAVGDAVDYYPVRVQRPETPMGVAESWNWFIRNTREERIIVNDDVIFEPQSIDKLVSHDLDLAWAAGCGFSCFVIRDACVMKLGMFDEAISPGYGYYEDEDYLQRLDGRGTKPANATSGNVVCGVRHVKSATLQAATRLELLEHHRKFKIAQANYARKWGVEEEFNLVPSSKIRMEVV